MLLSPNLSPILAGVLRPPPWSRLVLVSGLVSQLVSGLGCSVHSFLRSCLPTSLRSGMLCPPSLVSFCSCLPTCRPSWLGCCVRLPGLVLLLSPVLSPNLSPVLLLPPNLSPILAGALRPPPGLVFLLSLVLSPNLSGLGCCVRLPSLVLLLSPNLSPILAGVLRSLVSGLVSQQLSGLGCCVRLPGLVLLLSPVLSPSFLASGLACCVRLVLLLSPNLFPILAGVLRPPPWSRLALVSGFVSQLVSGLGCCVRLPGLVLLLSPVLSPNLSPV